MRSSRILELSTYCLIVAAVLCPVLGYWALKLRFGTAFVESWLPGEDEARATYHAFREQFGEDKFLIVSWPNCTLDDPRLATLTHRLRTIVSLRPELAVHAVSDSATALDQLTQGPSQLDSAEAMRRLSGFAVGADGTSFISLRIATEPAEHRADLIDMIRDEAKACIGIPRDQLILAGEPFQVYMIDRASRETMQYFVLPSTLMALWIAWLCLRKIRLTILVFALAGIAQVIGFAIIAFCVGEMSTVLVVLPTLLFMLTLSAAIHLTSYYVDSGGDDNKLAGANALRLGASPCLMATLTTVFGFGSLTVSRLIPVWQFGALAALGLLISSAMLLSVFPAASRLGIRRKASLSPSGLASQVESPGFALTAQKWLVGFTHNHANLITVLGLMLLAFALWGIRRLETSTDFVDMFPEHSEALQSLSWVQRHLGPIDALELTVRFPPSIPPSTDPLVQLELIQSIHHALEDIEHVHSVMSAMTFLPNMPSGPGTRNTIRRAVFRKVISANHAELMDQGLLAESNTQQTWRISTRLNDLYGENYAITRDSLLASTGSILERFNQENQGAEAVLQLTGMRAVIEKAHFAILSDLGSSFVAAFFLITPVMMFIARGVLSGLLLMIPNVLPVALVFGCMGWLGVRLDVASILTASVALGIAVDDTLHFINWYGRSLRSGKSNSDSVSAAIDACARPMLQTSLICAAAMLPFFFSEFLPTSKFASLMILILSGAILGDLILLPAMLQSPLGRLMRFGSRGQTGETELK